jgi:low affinity Fe/Cu permease
MRPAVHDEHHDPLAGPTAFVSAIVSVALWATLGPMFDSEGALRRVISLTTPVVVALRKLLE